MKENTKKTVEFRDWAFSPRMGKVASLYSIKQKKETSDSDLELLAELHKGIMAEQDPVQRELGLYEFNNPSVVRYEGVQNRAIMIKELGELVKYKAVVVNDRVGTDFATNQPKYKAREIIVE